MSATKDALRLTTSTIDRRAFHFRNLVVLVVLLVVACPIAALALWSFTPLVFWLAALPLCAFYFVLDGWLVARWQRQILQSWRTGELHLADFVQSISSLKLLPAATLRGMLAVLPHGSDDTPLDRMPLDARAAIVRAIAGLHRIELERTFAYAMSYGIGAFLLGFAIADWNWAPLLGFGGIAIALAAEARRRRRRITRCEEDLSDFRDSRKPA